MYKMCVYRMCNVMASSLTDAFSSMVSIGSPPPLGKGSGFLYLVVPQLRVNGTNRGPAVLMIKETFHNGTWGPPGGETDKTDHSPMYAALREFGEEVGADYRMLAKACSEFQLVRIHVGKSGKNETWAMIVDLEAGACENALFKDNRTHWKLSKRMHTHLSNETSGYAFVELSAILGADATTGEFAIGPYTSKLRLTRRTMQAAKKISTLPGIAAYPLVHPVPAPKIALIELYAIHLRITPDPNAINHDVKRAIDSQAVWGGLHITITGFAMRSAKCNTSAQTPRANMGCEVHGGSLDDFMNAGEKLLCTKGPWRPSDLRVDGGQINVKSYYIMQLEQIATRTNLSKVKRANNAHVSVGNKSYAPAVLDAMKNPSTKWTIGICVIAVPQCSRSSIAQFVRIEDERVI